MMRNIDAVFVDMERGSNLKSRALERKENTKYFNHAFLGGLFNIPISRGQNTQ